MNAQTINRDELIDRYVYDVVRRLPAAQVQDVEQELRGLIDDMLDHRGGSPAQQDVVAVLAELGRPAVLAGRYRGAPRYLIGPEYMDLYLLVLKIVLLAAGLGTLAASVFGAVAEPPHNVWLAGAQGLASVMAGLFQAFAWVTLSFALAQRLNAGSPPKDDWKPQDLPKVPSRGTRIKPGEPIAGMVFAVLALVLVNAAPHLLSAYIVDGQGALTVIPLFDLAVWRERILLINILVLLGLAKEIVKLLSGRYTLPLALQVAVLNTASMVLALLLFMPAGLWNADLVHAVTERFPAAAEGITMIYDVGLYKKVLAIIIVGGSVVDTAVTCAKAVFGRKATGG